MSTNPEVFIRRTKLRRKFEEAFRSLNLSVRARAKAEGKEPFFTKYSDHLLDRAIQREIDEEYVFSVLSKIPDHLKEINEFLAMPWLPIDPKDIDENIEYKPMRLEITDGNLWLGFTMDIPRPGKGPSIKCRMAFVNDKRLKGKISTKVIHIN